MKKKFELKTLSKKQKHPSFKYTLLSVDSMVGQIGKILKVFGTIT